MKFEALEREWKTHFLKLDTLVTLQNENPTEERRAKIKALVVKLWGNQSERMTLIKQLIRGLDLKITILDHDSRKANIVSDRE